jgi:hypothetical protein
MYYYLENGKVVFTEKFHLERGYCCDNDVIVVYLCKHNPYYEKNNNKRRRYI